MFIHYKKTHLEEYVEQLYIDHHIMSPKDITIDCIAARLRIRLKFSPIESRSHRLKSGTFCMILDSRKNETDQRKDFLHELGHLLRHEGNQIAMLQSFVQYQEEDSEQFALYALMPFFMIERLELSPDRKQAVQQLATMFAVGTELASKRYGQILRREFEGTTLAETSAAYQPGKEVKSCVSDEVQIMAYYDPSGTYDGPSQLIVILDEWTLINCREIELPIGERLPEIDPEEMFGAECTPVHSSDVICFDGVVTLQVYELLYRYGLTKQTFVIHMRDVEMLMARDQSMIRKLSW
ncbi:protein of unknown function [Paenibacillus sophorae]|uniref:ImmA/IrrE family metallo-endopeptidase n=1 Tax=Paenibacillus sophorae TaxID=1333845 RepID=A0A1H8VU66_9BACL|nr:ImmA/IrrE family metallo-endopeptidase [Paenibacillus sophorae]QWU15713.1 ImmA/IrrE family metallo-endopeptidase [Paenibacillus sophorae]SEP18864.1 protein of unknown function [Paenibacillus sophorae]